MSNFSGVHSRLGGLPLLTNCAAPDCSATFRYLHQGRVFVFEPVKPGKTQLADSGDPASDSAEPRYAWLCEKCLRKFTIACDDSGNLRLVKRSQPEASAEALPSLLWGT